jgi:hypothetical protein
MFPQQPVDGRQQPPTLRRRGWRLIRINTKIKLVDLRKSVSFSKTAKYLHFPSTAHQASGGDG